MNIIRNLKVDLDRIELFSDMGYEYNVDEYKDSMVKHLKELFYNQDPHQNKLIVKAVLSKEIFEKMSDQSAAQALREIIFASDNIIDWDRAFEAIQKYMPEMKMFD